VEGSVASVEGSLSPVEGWLGTKGTVLLGAVEPVVPVGNTGSLASGLTISRTTNAISTMLNTTAVTVKIRFVLFLGFFWGMDGILP
jgi:hypothetical protein